MKKIFAGMLLGAILLPSVAFGQVNYSQLTPEQKISLIQTIQAKIAELTQQLILMLQQEALAAGIGATASSTPQEATSTIPLSIDLIKPLMPDVTKEIVPFLFGMDTAREGNYHAVFIVKYKEDGVDQKDVTVSTQSDSGEAPDVITKTQNIAFNPELQGYGAEVIFSTKTKGTHTVTFTINGISKEITFTL